MSQTAAPTVEYSAPHCSALYYSLLEFCSVVQSSASYCITLATVAAFVASFSSAARCFAISRRKDTKVQVSSVFVDYKTKQSKGSTGLSVLQGCLLHFRMDLMESPLGIASLNLVPP